MSSNMSHFKDYEESRARELTGKSQRLLEFMETTGFCIVQTNGQRVSGPTDMHVVPPQGCEVFIGKIPQTMFEDELIPLFNSVGHLFEFRLMMQFTEANRGFGFARYMSPEQAWLAVEKLNGKEVRPGRSLVVTMSRDNCRLYLGGLPMDRSAETLVQDIKEAIDGVVNVIIYSAVEDKRKHRGFAFVDFNNHRTAALARRRLASEFIRACGKDISIDWAAPEIQPSWDTMSKVKVLFVRNVTLETDEACLFKNFSAVGPAGCVNRVKKSKDYAFVHFDTRQAAQDAMMFWNGRELNNAKLTVTWAKPVKHYEYLRFKMDSITQRANARMFKPHLQNDSPKWGNFSVTQWGNGDVQNPPNDVNKKKQVLPYNSPQAGQSLYKEISKFESEKNLNKFMSPPDNGGRHCHAPMMVIPAYQMAGNVQHPGPGNSSFYPEPRGGFDQHMQYNPGYNSFGSGYGSGYAQYGYEPYDLIGTRYRM